MAKECVSVTFEDGHVWEYCWEEAQAYPTWNSEDVTTGLRLSNEPTARAWKTCQYYLKGMPSVCKWWKEGKIDDEGDTTTSGSFYCSFIKDNKSDNPNDPSPEIPSGYNFGQCDFLGRRGWCSKYEESKPFDPDEWICAAPNPYVTGLGKKRVESQEAIFSPIPRKDIFGYNDQYDGTGTGKCDCHGMGRGITGCDITGNDPHELETNLSRLPIVCNFYKPWQMGFGLIEPHKKWATDVEPDGVTITDLGWIHAQEPLAFRLPLNYVVYNCRAKFQKCQWWDDDYSKEYDHFGRSIYLVGKESNFINGKVKYCKCPDSAVDGYRTLASGVSQAQFALKDVWAEAGGPVCNGVRPDCPGYSGKWIYLTNEKMLPGMPVTANQILELRFWANDWDSQEEYDEYYTQKPNFIDPKSPDIFTFTRWQHLNPVSPAESIMQGKRLKLCQPAPLNRKEFTTDYIQEELITYRQVDMGTATADSQRHFPSLIREPKFNYSVPLTIIYPYYNDDSVFNPEICAPLGPPGHRKRSCNMHGDSIRAIGQTIRKKDVFVLNTEVIPIDDIVKQYSGIYSVATSKNKDKSIETIRYEIYNAINDAVVLGIRKYEDYIVDQKSDEIFGTFITKPIKLRYGVNNRLLICVDLGNGEWEYRWRIVESVFYGGIALQTEYEHEYPTNPFEKGYKKEGYLNTQPEYISPPAEAEFEVLAFGGSEDGEKTGAEIIVTSSIDFPITGFSEYAYRLIEETREDDEQYKWGAIGNSNKIFAEIELGQYSYKLNYIYPWDIVSAKLKIKEDDYGTPVRDDVPDEIELKKVLSYEQSLPPNACVLEPKDENIRIRFFTSDWDLVVSTKYDRLVDLEYEIYENTIIKHGAGSNDFSRALDESQIMSIGGRNSSYTVNNINNISASFMVHFFDENGRIISTFATKLLTNMVRESCRNIDIFYAYEAEGRKYMLEPESGFCIDIKKDKPMHDPYKHVEIPDCGDHQYFPWLKPGPMWFPFNSCRGYDMYDEWTICNNCQASYIGPMNDGVVTDEGGRPQYAGGVALKRNDYRYCGPYKYEAFGEVRGNWAAACDCGCKFSYSDASSASVFFSGYARKMTTVDLNRYKYYGWAFPPFGNEGRELVEKFISQDYVDHSMSRSPYHRSEWMPMMMDHTVFFMSFNSYDHSTEDIFHGVGEYYSLEPFRYINQMNFFVRDYLESSGGMSAFRYSWDEVFEIHHEGNCSYPFPAYPVGQSSTKAIFYYFKEKDTAWAWQEWWRDIERDIANEYSDEYSDIGQTNTTFSKLDFLRLERPKYVYDFYKKEHKFISLEGYYRLIYTAPVSTPEGDAITYPTISLGSGPERAFEIFYDKYDDGQITWKTEGGKATVSGSSQSDNIYEQTGDTSKWMHDKDTLFDETAVSGTGEAKQLGREVIINVDWQTGKETAKYYNTGVIAHIPRNRLYYLPQKYTEMYYFRGNGVNGSFVEDNETIPTLSTPEYDLKSNDFLPSVCKWKTPEVFIKSESSKMPNSGEMEGWVFSKLVISGIWGHSQNFDKTWNEIVKPGVKFIVITKDGEEYSYKTRSSMPLIAEVPSSDQGIEPYYLKFDFLISPVDMFKTRADRFRIELYGLEDMFICINEIKLYKTEYCDNTETIKVWERKYIISLLTNQSEEGSINLDGPGDNLHYQEDLNNSGQYFPFRSAKYEAKEIIAEDKTKAVYCGVRYSENEHITDISYDNLHEIEETEQKILYEYAFNLDSSDDIWTYYGLIPLKYKGFGIDHNLYIFYRNIYALYGEILWITSQKLPWKSNKLKKEFKQYDYWRPGGHYYTWDPRYHRERCMLFGPAENVFSGYYVHVDHVGVGNPLEVDPSKPIDPANSYYSLRFYTQQAKYDRSLVLAGGEPEYGDRIDGTMPYNVPLI